VRGARAPEAARRAERGRRADRGRRRRELVRRPRNAHTTAAAVVDVAEEAAVRELGRRQQITGQGVRADRAAERGQDAYDLGLVARAAPREQRHGRGSHVGCPRGRGRGRDARIGEVARVG
jgi:hypothetical protein